MRSQILVVENHPDLRAEIVAVLEREHCECEGVSTGEAALLKLREHDYGYIVLDIDAPTAGAAVFDSLAARRGGLEKLILLTESEDPEDMTGAAARCMQLFKPFDAKQLLACLPKRE
jgi:DNA-binding response OmpR family regulator